MCRTPARDFKEQICTWEWHVSASCRPTATTELGELWNSMSPGCLWSRGSTGKTLNCQSVSWTNPQDRLSKTQRSVCPPYGTPELQPNAQFHCRKILLSLLRSSGKKWLSLQSIHAKTMAPQKVEKMPNDFVLQPLVLQQDQRSTARACCG